MRLPAWWNSLSLFWKVYLLIVLVITLIVLLVEAALEPSLEMILELEHGAPDFHELALWSAVILIISALSGLAITKYLTREIQKLADAAKRITAGDLSARIRDTGDDDDSLNQLAMSFNEMAESLEKLLANERRLLADISHELRSPLTRMGLATDILARKASDPEVAATLQRLDKDLATMRGLVSLLLQQGKHRLSAGEKPENIDLSSLLRAISGDYQFQAKEIGKGLASFIDSGISISGYPMLVHSIFSNVLSNAVFYTPPGSTVELRARSEAGKVTVVIRDYGPGVPPETLGDIFRAFYRVERSRNRSQGGVGLGLAIAKDAAELHQGEIQARNANPGLEVTITLPA